MSPHLHVFLTRARHESRFLREASAALRAGFTDSVVLAGVGGTGLAPREQLAEGIAVERIHLRADALPPGMPWHLVRGIEWRGRVVRLSQRLRPELVHAHSLYSLPVAVAVRRRLGIPLVYDAHELETERNGLRGVRQWAERRLERRLIGACDAVLCVSDAIADWYVTRYGIVRPTVVRNIPEAPRGVMPAALDSPLRAKLGLGPEAMVFLYQGGLFRGRRVEQLLEAFAGIEAPRHLVFMGYGELEGLVRARAARQPNVHFLAAVPPGEVLAHTAGADVGICGVENVCLSYYYALPNKFFEYLHAGVGVLAPDYPELRRVIGEWQCGWVLGEETAAWRAAILALDRPAIRVAQERAQSARAAFGWPAEEARLLDVYRQVLALDARTVRT